jgi:DNA-binding beta-propeller fold protein YncE
VAVDASGDIYIADTVDSVIRKVTASSGNIATVAGDGTGGYLGDKGPATKAELAGPWGVTVDSVGNLYIADTGNEVIRKVTF